jgi:hypothetical protein
VQRVSSTCLLHKSIGLGVDSVSKHRCSARGCDTGSIRQNSSDGIKTTARTFNLTFYSQNRPLVFFLPNVEGRAIS